MRSLGNVTDITNNAAWLESSWCPSLLLLLELLVSEARRLVKWLGKLLEGAFGKVDGNLLLLQNRQYLTVSVMRRGTAAC